MAKGKCRCLGLGVQHLQKDSLSKNVMRPIKSMCGMGWTQKMYVMGSKVHFFFKGQKCLLNLVIVISPSPPPPQTTGTHPTLQFMGANPHIHGITGRSREMVAHTAARRHPRKYQGTPPGRHGEMQTPPCFLATFQRDQGRQSQKRNRSRKMKQSRVGRNGNQPPSPQSPQNKTLP